jgi:hypothetical protein
MTNFANDFSAMRERAMQELSRPSDPLMDVGMAALQSYGNPQASFAQNLSAIRGQQSQRTMGAYNLLRTEQQMAMQEKTAERQDKLLALQTLAKMSEMGNRHAKAIMDTVKSMTDDPAQRVALLNAAHESPTEITADNAMVELPKLAQQIGVTNKRTPGFQETQLDMWKRLENKKRAGGVLTPQEEVDYDAASFAIGKTMVGADNSRSIVTPNALRPSGQTETPGITTSSSGVIEVRPGMPKPLPQGAQEDISQGIVSFRLLDTIERGLPAISGIVGGRVEQGKAAVGLADKTSVDAIQAINQYKLSAQSLIKGIPSNFDVGTLIDTLPQPGLPEATNRSRLEQSKGIARTLVANTLAYYKALNFHIPPNVLEQAKAYGVDPDSVTPWSGRGDPLEEAKTQAKAANSVGKSDPLGLR